MKLSPELEAMLPTEEDVKYYEEHGYYVTGKILPDRIIDRALSGAKRHWAGSRDWRLSISDGYSNWTPDDGPGIRNSEYTALQNRKIQELVKYPILGAVAARLARTSIVRLWDDQLVAKPPSTGPSGPVVGWHTDRAYWMTCTSEAMLTAWIPLQDTPLEMGPVIYIDGSHRWTGTDDMRNFNSSDLETLEARVLDGAPSDKKRVIALQKGQVSFHNCRLIHGSDVNRGNRARVSIALHMQDGGNRYRVFPNSVGEPWRTTNDRLARTGPDGAPDYTDPAVFPVLWSDADR